MFKDDVVMGVDIFRRKWPNWRNGFAICFKRRQKNDILNRKQ